MDLMALAEVQDQLPKELASDLAGFAARVLRELSDLPDGAPLADFCTDLEKIDASLVPASIRECVAALAAERSSSDAAEALSSLLAGLTKADPVALVLPVSAPEGSAEAVTKVVKGKAAPKKRRRTTVVDDERAEWITADVLSRVAKYGNRGLKEHVIVAGSRHRSPFPDLTEAEVLSILRRMKREGRIRHSAGRWMKI